MCLCWEAAYLGCWIESELIWQVGKIFPRWEKEKNEEEEQNIILDHETWKNKNENNKKKKANKQTQEQMGGWLNRFNFGCAWRNTLNTGLTIYNKMTLDLIKIVSNEMDKVSERRIQKPIT